MGYDVINRDPEEIIGFAKAVDDYCETTGYLLNASDLTINGVLCELDDKCYELGEKYAEQVKDIKKQLEYYKEFSAELDKKAKNLLEAYSEHFF